MYKEIKLVNWINCRRQPSGKSKWIPLIYAFSLFLLKMETLIKNIHFSYSHLDG